MFSNTNKVDVNRRFNYNSKKQYNSNNNQFHSNDSQRHFGKIPSPSNLIAPQMLAVAAAAAAAHINDINANNMIDFNNHNVRKRNQSDFRKNFKNMKDESFNNMNNDRKRPRYNQN